MQCGSHTKNFYSVFLSLLIAAAIAVMCSVPVYASTFSGGDGSIANPYQISSKADLQQLATDVNGGNSYEGKYFTLTKNIDLGGTSWTPIGVYSFPFSGSFDGNDKAISGLYVNSADCYDAGLFGALSGKEAFIENLTVSGTVICSDDGGIAGLIVGNSEYGKILHCKVSGTVTSAFWAGGIAGGNYCGSIENCEAAAVTITAKNTVWGTYAGGIAGCNEGDGNGSAALISNCSVTSSSVTVGDYNGTSSVSSAGGISGYSDQGSSIESCSVSGTDIKGGSKTAGGDAAVNGVNIGGIAGYLTDPETEIKNCTVTASTVTGGNCSCVGGVAGYASKDVSLSGNTVDTATQRNVTGGTGSKISKAGTGSDNTDGSGGTSSCNAGFGALALLAVLPLAWRRKK